MEYPIYSFLYYLDDLVNKNNIQQLNNTDECGGFEISYQILSEYEIDVEFGWSSYEEHEDNNVKIIFSSENIKIKHKYNGHSCFGGDFNHEVEYTFNDENELILWFKSEIPE